MAFSSVRRLAFGQRQHVLRHMGAVGLLSCALIADRGSGDVRLEDQKHRTYATRGNLREFHRYYREGEKLGEGTFAVVKRGVDLSTKEAVAIKAIDKAKSDEDCRANEVQVMEKMGKHPNLVGLHNIYEGEDFLFIIQDLAEGGELFERVVRSGELNEREAARLFEGAVEAVEHLHARHIAHLDIKPENLLLRQIPKSNTPVKSNAQVKSNNTAPAKSNAQVKSNTAPEKSTTSVKSAKPPVSTAAPKEEAVYKTPSYHKRTKMGEKMEEIVVLADFGLAVQDDEETFDICVGTPAYWAPEMVRREKFGLAVDMWALGCVLYILLCGIHPFDPSGDAPEAQILARVASGNYDKSNREYQALSEPAKDLIRHLLDPDSHKRYTARQTLQHPWLASAAAQEDRPLSSIQHLSGFRVLTLIKTGMRDMLHQAEQDLFDHLDVNGDGYISKEELAKGLRVVGFDLPDAEIEAFLKLVDSDGDELISRKEFAEVLAKRFENDVVSPVRTDHASLEDLATLFKAYDKDGDGYISADDVHHVLSLLGSSVTRSIVQNEWASVVDEHGLVSFAQFVKHVRALEAEKRNNDGVASVSSVLKLRDRRDLLRSRR